MINFGFTASTAGIGQAAGNPAGKSLVQGTEAASGAAAGFFGMLLALFSRPIGPDLPVMTGSDAGRAGTSQSQEESASQGLAGRGGAIVSGEADMVSGDAAAAAAWAQVGAPVLAGGGNATGQAIHYVRTLTAAAAAADEAGPGIPVMSDGESDGLDILLAQVTGRQLEVLHNSMKWATDIEPAERDAGGDAPVWHGPGAGIAGGRGTSVPPGAPVIADVLALNREMDRPGGGVPANRIAGFLPDNLFRVSEGADEPVQSRTLEAFARMAEGTAALRQTVPDTETGGSTTVIPGQGLVSMEEANGASLTAVRSEAVLASLLKMAPARRVEPVLAREDVEEAFTYGAPQEAASSGGKTAAAPDVWARSAVSRVHGEVLDARAAGKTTVSFDITTESGELVRVRIAMRSNVVTGRIGVMDAETKQVLALHIPELNQRLQMENLVPERFDVYVMNGNGEGGRRGQQRKPRWASGQADEQKGEDDFMFVSSGTGTFEKWA